MTNGEIRHHGRRMPGAQCLVRECSTCFFAGSTSLTCRRLCADTAALFPPEKPIGVSTSLHSTQVAKESEACATSILVRLQKKMTIKSRMTKALKAEVVQKARQFRTITPLTLEVK